MSKSEEITNIATKRGFFFPTAEIYNAKAGFWTYGHLGKLMRSKFENLWLKHFLSLDDNYWEIDGSYILPQKVFEASGHLENFKDPLTGCKKCHFRFRADELIEDNTKEKAEGLDEKELTKLIKKHKLKCPKCRGELEDVKFFNMMFELKLGATGQDSVYLAPETAQNPFISFKREFEALRRKLPMGLAMIGRSFRNEISPRQGFFRLREFNQAELQIFFDPAEVNKHKDWDSVKDYKLIVSFDGKKEKEIKASELVKKKIPKFYIYHLVKIQEFYLDKIKIPKNKFRFRQLTDKEKAFYNKVHFDIEIDMETLNGFKEIGGLHYRTDHDLKGHEKVSGEKFTVQVGDKKVMPHVLEISLGIDRSVWAMMDVFFKKEKNRSLFSFPFSVCPIEAAVFPLVNKDKLPEKAEQIYNMLNKIFVTIYDKSGSIGKMYRRVDEIGCPAMITVDHQTLKDDTVTLRNRDDMKQIRVKVEELPATLVKLYTGTDLKELGKII